MSIISISNPLTLEQAKFIKENDLGTNCFTKYTNPIIQFLNNNNKSYTQTPIHSINKYK